MISEIDNENMSIYLSKLKELRCERVKYNDNK